MDKEQEYQFAKAVERARYWQAQAEKQGRLFQEQRAKIAVLTSTVIFLAGVGLVTGILAIVVRLWP